MNTLLLAGYLIIQTQGVAMIEAASVRNSAILAVIKIEGGYVNDPNDDGGETKYGISKRANSDVDIKNLTKKEAIKIYRARYWNLIQGDALPAPVALVVFDFAVNAGPKRAIEELQGMVGAHVDGVMGPLTETAVRESWNRNDTLLIKWYGKRRMKAYMAMGKWKHYGDGWTHRVLETTMKATAWAAGIDYLKEQGLA